MKKSECLIKEAAYIRKTEPKVKVDEYNVKYMQDLYKKVNYKEIIWNYAEHPVA